MAKAEKRDSETEKLSRLNQLTLRCGDCLHFKGSPHPAYGAPCHSLGIKPYAAAPSCYTPNVMLFRTAGADTFAVLAALLARMSPQQSRILMGLLKSVGSLDKYGYTFLEKVYFKVGDDYLDNYFSGRILGVGLNGTIAVVGENYFHTAKSPLVAYVFPDSLLSSEKFKKRKTQLEKQGLVYAPRKPHRNKVEGDYEPPTMETSPELLEKMASKTFGKKTKPRVLKEGEALEVDIGQGPRSKKGEEEEEKVTTKKLHKRRASDEDEEDEDEEFED